MCPQLITAGSPRLHHVPPVMCLQTHTLQGRTDWHSYECITMGFIPPRAALTSRLLHLWPRIEFYMTSPSLREKWGHEMGLAVAAQILLVLIDKPKDPQILILCFDIFNDVSGEDPVDSDWLTPELVKKLLTDKFPSPAATICAGVAMLSRWSSFVVGTACVPEGQGKINPHLRKIKLAPAWWGADWGQLSLLRVSSREWAEPQLPSRAPVHQWRTVKVTFLQPPASPGPHQWACWSSSVVPLLLSEPIGPPQLSHCSSVGLLVLLREISFPLLLQLFPSSTRPCREETTLQQDHPW